MVDITKTIGIRTKDITTDFFVDGSTQKIFYNELYPNVLLEKNSQYNPTTTLPSMIRDRITNYQNQGFENLLLTKLTDACPIYYFSAIETVSNAISPNIKYTPLFTYNENQTNEFIFYKNVNIPTPTQDTHPITKAFADTNYLNKATKFGTILYTIVGTFTWTIPTGVTSATFTIVAGGGSGSAVGWGGGGGETVYHYATDLVSGNIVTITVGAGGVGQVYNSSSLNSGNVSSIKYTNNLGSIVNVIAYGGIGAPSSGTSVGGAGGGTANSSTSTTLRIVGGTGSAWATANSGALGGIGGGSFGPGAPGALTGTSSPVTGGNAAPNSGGGGGGGVNGGTGGSGGSGFIRIQP